MAKAVFIAKINSIYDDLPEERYHFPKQYLKRIEATVGDWIIYYEPRRNNGRKVFYSTAQVKAIRDDPNAPDHFYAEIGNYLEFENAVPFKENEFYYAKSLLNSDGTLNPGKAQNAVYHISEEEYKTILEAGFIHILGGEFSYDQSTKTLNLGFSEDPSEFERPIVETVTRRLFRDQAFSKTVKDAYNQTCAMTGLRIINGGGRAEVQAAHIKPVSQRGPDSVRNGIALSGTVHWMFDRGLVSINDNYEVIKVKEKIPIALNALLAPKGKIILPNRPDLVPHPTFLKFHRENIFKG